MTQNILITGTSSGFGRLTALTLARQGHRVFATMRETAGRNRAAADQLRALRLAEGLRLEIVELELTDDASVAHAIAEVLERAGHLDVVVNNAGYAVLGLEETLAPGQLLAQLDVNLVGTQRILREVLPGMRGRGAGLLVHVSSGLGRLVLPLMGAYCASKAALEALVEAYRYELKPTGIESVIVQPGAFPTDFRRGIQPGVDQQRAAGYGPLAGALDQMGAMFDAMLTGPGAQDPQEVADAIAALIASPTGSRPDRVVVDRQNPDGVVALNRAHAEVQAGLLGGMGMVGLV